MGPRLVLVWLALAALAASLGAAQSAAQTLRIRPQVQQVSAEEELAPLPDSAPFQEEQPNWVEPEMASPQSEAVLDGPYEEDECPPGSAYTRRGLRARMANSRRHADALYERLSSPERARSWTNRPLSFGGFVGGMFGTELTPSIDQEPGVFVGGRLGWDFAEYWGLESRLGGVEMNLRASDDSILVDKNELTVIDGDLLYYPWGESRLRPFLSLGMGLQQSDFVNENGVRVKDKLFSVPIGIGFKFRMDQRLAIRFDLQDNYAFAGGNDVESQNNISITGGLEFRFGGRKKNYWPWDPSRTWW